MTWKKILKEIRPDPTADPNDSGATGISPQTHGVTGDPVYDITEHTKFPGMEVHGSAGNANIVAPGDADGKIASLISYYGEGWQKKSAGANDRGQFIIVRPKQGGPAPTQINPRTAQTQLNNPRTQTNTPSGGKWLPGQ
jgi:hypothetical protein